MADALLTFEPDSLRLNLDPLHCAICREWLPQGGFRVPIRITPLRVMAAFTAMTTLLMVFAIQRVSGDERIEVPKPAIIEARAEQPPPADLQKTDRKSLIPVRQIELTRTAPAPAQRLIRSRLSQPTCQPRCRRSSLCKRREDANDTTTSAAVIICRKSTRVGAGAGGAVKEIRRGKSRQGKARQGGVARLGAARAWQGMGMAWHGKGIQLHRTSAHDGLPIGLMMDYRSPIWTDRPDYRNGQTDNRTRMDRTTLRIRIRTKQGADDCRPHAWGRMGLRHGARAPPCPLPPPKRPRRPPRDFTSSGGWPFLGTKKPNRL